MTKICEFASHSSSYLDLGKTTDMYSICSPKEWPTVLYVVNGPLWPASGVGQLK